MKARLFEFEDLPWFPEILRSGGTDYLRYLLTAFNFYGPVTPVLAKGLSKTGVSNMVDLCSGGGGVMLEVQRNISKHCGRQIPVMLTDKFPNEEAFQYIGKLSGGSISYLRQSVDAHNVPQEISGFRTIFSAFHHFDETMAVKVLQDAVDKKSGIAVFDGGDKKLLSILGILFLHPFGFLLFTPFFRPFRFSRILFTYILPLIPLYTIWDGVISILRLYSPKQLLAMAHQTRGNRYVWESGYLENSFGMKVSYLMGYPEN